MSLTRQPLKQIDDGEGNPTIMSMINQYAAPLLHQKKRTLIENFMKNFASNEQEKLKKIEKLLNLPQEAIRLHLDTDIQILAIWCLDKVLKTTIQCEFLMKIVKGQQCFADKQNELGSCKPKLIRESFKLEFYQKFSTIFNYGSYGNHYYIVLQGQVITLIPNQKHKDMVEHQKKEIITPPIKAGFFQKAQCQIKPDIDIDVNQAENFSKLDDLLRTKFSNFMNVYTYKSGMGFGEIALITNSTRSATMVASEDTFVMTLHKKAFEEIMGSYLNQKKQENLNFLRKYIFFSNMTDRNLVFFTLEMRQNTYLYGQNLYDEGDQLKDIYLIQKGEVSISKKVIIKDNNYIENKKNINSLNQSLSNKIDKHHQHHIFISIQGKNSCIGADEILKDLPYRQSKCTVISNQAIIWQLDKEKFLTILRKNPKIMVSFALQIESELARQQLDISKKISTKLDGINQEKELIKQIDFKNQLTKEFDKQQEDRYENRISRHQSTDPINLIFQQKKFNRFEHPNFKVQKKIQQKSNKLVKLTSENIDLNYIDGDLSQQNMLNSKETLQMQLIRMSSKKDLQQIQYKQRLLQYIVNPNTAPHKKTISEIFSPEQKEITAFSDFPEQKKYFYLQLQKMFKNKVSVQEEPKRLIKQSQSHSSFFFNQSHKKCKSEIPQTSQNLFINSSIKQSVEKMPQTSQIVWSDHKQFLINSSIKKSELNSIHTYAKSISEFNSTTNLYQNINKKDTQMTNETLYDLKLNKRKQFFLFKSVASHNARNKNKFTFSVQSLKQIYKDHNNLSAVQILSDKEIEKEKINLSMTPLNIKTAIQ